MIRFSPVFGWVLVVAPLLLASSAGAQEIPVAEGAWDPRFAPPGLGRVNAVALDRGTLYAAMGYDLYQPSGLYEWDGSAWRTLADFRVSELNGLAFEEDTVYVGGYYLQMPGGTRYVARLTRSTGEWRPLGTGVNGEVSALERGMDGTLFVAGRFTLAGGAAAPGLARWDSATQTWSTVGDGPGFVPDHLAANGTTLFAAGRDPARGDSSAVARWDGTAWETIGVAPDDILGLAIGPSGQVHVSGCFEAVKGRTGPAVSVPHLATLAESGWEPGPAGAADAGTCLEDVTVRGEELFVGIVDERGGPYRPSSVARWTGTTWVRPAGHVTGELNDLYVTGDRVYFGGWVRGATGAALAGVGSWNLASGIWEGYMARDLYGVTGVGVWAASGAYDGTIYVGGRFATAGNVLANSVARWTGNGWEALGSGLDDPAASVYAIAADGNRVLIGGSFDSVAGLRATNVALWNTTLQSWVPLGAGIPGTVTAVDFLAGAPVAVVGYRVWRWRNGRWETLGTAAPNIEIDAMTVLDDGRLVISGSFNTVNGLPARNIAVYRNGSWSALGEGLPRPGIPTAHGDDLWVPLMYENGEGGSDLARWLADIQSWEIGPGGLADFDPLCSTSARGAAVLGDLLYVGGGIVGCQKGGPSITHIARWDGTSWSSLGSGVNGGVRALVADGASLFAVGGFTKADDKPSSLVGIWTDAGISSTTHPPPDAVAVGMHVYPNPANGPVAVEFTLDSAATVRIEVYDAVGRLVAVPVDGMLSPGFHTRSIDAARLAPGVYWVRLRGSGTARPFAVAR